MAGHRPNYVHGKMVGIYPVDNNGALKM